MAYRAGLISIPTTVSRLRYLEGHSGMEGRESVDMGSKGRKGGGGADGIFKVHKSY